jgi:hypothetical protein
MYLKDARNPNFTWNAPTIQPVLPCVLSKRQTNPS